MRQKKTALWIMVYLLALGLLAAGAEFGDQLAVATQQYEQRQIPKRWAELSRQVAAVQDGPDVFPMLRPVRPMGTSLPPIGDCVDLFRVGPGSLSVARSSECLKLLSRKDGD